MKSIRKWKLKFAIGLIAIILTIAIINLYLAYKMAIRNQKNSYLETSKILTSYICNKIDEQIDDNKLVARNLIKIGFENIDYNSIFDDITNGNQGNQLSAEDIMGYEFVMKNKAFSKFSKEKIRLMYINNLIKPKYSNIIHDWGYMCLKDNLLYSSLGFNERVLNDEFKKNKFIMNTTYMSEVKNISNDKYVFYIIEPVYSNKKFNKIDGYIYRSIDVSKIYTQAVETLEKDKNLEYQENINYFVQFNDEKVIDYSVHEKEQHKKIINNNNISKNDLEIINSIEYNKFNKGKSIVEKKSKLYVIQPIICNKKYLMSLGVVFKIKVLIEEFFIKQILISSVLIIVILLLIFKFLKKFTEYEKQKAYFEAKFKSAYNIRKLNEEINRTQYEIIKAMVKFVEMKDSYTAGHSGRVTEYAVGLAKYMNFSKEDILKVKYGAILHDIGKVGIDENVLNKAGRLTDEEFNLIKEHTRLGYNALKSISFLKEETDAVLHHHERLDGKGYPDGLRGEEISIYCRILSVSDSFDAMTSNRVYRRKLSVEKAFEELVKNSGTQFDPKIVNRFIEFINASYDKDLNLLNKSIFQQF